MLGRIVYCNNVSVEPWSRVRPRKGLGETDRVRSDRVEVVVVFDIACYLVLIVVIWCRSSSCLFVSLFYGQIFIAEIQFCRLFYFKRIHFCILVSASHSSSRNPTHPPVFIAPRDFRPRKMWFLCQNAHFCVIFVGFLPITKSNMDRFWNGFHSRIALA